MSIRPKATLVLSNGQRFTGHLIGSPVTSSGELVFSTGMVGYSESITDPSYFGQILIFSYPLIGNYGVPPVNFKQGDLVPKGFESYHAQAAGVIVTVDCEDAFHWNSFQSLDHWLKGQQMPGIAGIDTRYLVQLARSGEKILGRIEPEKPSGFRSLGRHTHLIEKANTFFDPSDHEILTDVSSERPWRFGQGKTKIAVIDCGVKWNIIRHLVSLDCEVELVPWNADLSKIDCSAWLLSNGPGDPNRAGTLIAGVREVLKDKKPVLGICLGHQILALAAGAETRRLPYGHRSHNQPVYELGTRRGYITSQNHGFVVDEKTLPKDWDVWFWNANDETVEGIKHKSKPFRSVQFHPEAAGGPRDTGWIIEQFVAEVR